MEREYVRTDGIGIGKRDKVSKQERPWENLVLLEKEESLPPMRVKKMCKAAISHKFNTGGKSGEVSLQGAAGLVGRNM